MTIARRGGPYLAASLGLAAACLASPGRAADAPAVDGAKLYDQFCAQCHGAGLAHPVNGAIDLRAFPSDQHGRFVNSVLNGKRAMPAWDGTITPAQVEDLWAYVLAAKAAPSN